MQANRWGSTSVAEITTKIDEIMPKNTKKAKEYAYGFLYVSKLHLGEKYNPCPALQHSQRLWF
jgi:hypothetical protein